MTSNAPSHALVLATRLVSDFLILIDDVANLSQVVALILTPSTTPEREYLLARLKSPVPLPALLVLRLQRRVRLAKPQPALPVSTMYFHSPFSLVLTSHTDTIETVTAPPTQEPQKSGPNVAGIAAGVVVGVVVVAALIGGGFFWMRRKRNAEIEEEHRRNAAVNAFISGGKPPSSSGGVSMTDSRLDPVLNRRMSDGSIADNQDYSRRILRVC